MGVLSVVIRLMGSAELKVGYLVTMTDTPAIDIRDT